ncbi:GldG family protein [bacterium]|nr:GldG family protein [bacterium]
MKRSVKYELNSIVSQIIVIVIVVISMMISYQYSKRWDLTKNKVNTLSQQSTDIVKNLQKPVNAYLFTEQLSRKKSIEDLLSMYEKAGRNFKYVTYDPAKTPQKAQEFGVTSDPSLYIEAEGGNRERISEPTEENITNAIARSLSVKEKIIYVLSGHGEATIDDNQKTDMKSLALLKESLEKEVYKVIPLLLKETGKIPEDASMIVIAGPTSKYFPKEIDIIENYLKNGGRALILTGNEFPKENKNFFDKYGFEFEDGYIYDKSSSMLGVDPSITVILAVTDSDITKGFQNLKDMYFMPLTSAFRYKEQIEGIDVLPVINTTSQCILKDSKQKNAEEEKSYTVGLTVERHVKGTDKVERLVVLGSSLMAGRTIISNGQNLNILLNSVAWLTGEKNLIAIRPKDEIFEPLNLTPRESAQFMFKIVIMFPVLIMGLWFSFRVAKKIAGRK